MFIDKAVLIYAPLKSREFNIICLCVNGYVFIVWGENRIIYTLRYRASFRTRSNVLFII